MKQDSQAIPALQVSQQVRWVIWLSHGEADYMARHQVRCILKGIVDSGLTPAKFTK